MDAAEFEPVDLVSGLSLRKPLDHNLLDGRILKTLRRQEERKESKARRQKEVRGRIMSIIRFIVRTNEPWNMLIPI